MAWKAERRSSFLPYDGVSLGGKVVGGYERWENPP